LKRSWLKYLSLLGLLGFMGPATGNAGFYGFFGFFGLAALGGIPSDERLQANINKAARNAFITGILIFVVTVILSTLMFGPSFYIPAFVVNFAVQIVVFVLSLRIFDRRGE
jgi:fatty acid desaturase